MPHESASQGGLMFGLGLPELLIILVIVLILFGTAKLPQIGSGLGQAIRDFKKGIRGEEPEDITTHENLPPKKTEKPSDETALTKDP